MSFINIFNKEKPSLGQYDHLNFFHKEKTSFDQVYLKHGVKYNLNYVDHHHQYEWDCYGKKNQCSGWTYLMWLLIYQRNDLDDIINKMIKEVDKIDFDIRNDEGYTALFMVVGKSDDETSRNIIVLLLSLGANPNIPNNNGDCPIIYASEFSRLYSSNDTVSILAKHNTIHINTTDNNGCTALMYACDNCNVTSSVETAVILLDNGADPNVKDNEYMTCLMLSVLRTRTTSSDRVVELLLNDQKTDINIKDDNGWTALSHIMDRFNQSSISTLKLLLSGGADPNTLDNKLIPPMAIFLKSESTIDPDTVHHVIELLLKHKADPNIISNGESILSIALKRHSKNQKLIKLLKKKSNKRIVKQIIETDHKTMKIYLNDDTSCPICLDEFKDQEKDEPIMFFRCGHAIHGQCHLNFKKNICPYCSA